MRSTLERLIKYYTDHHDVDEDLKTITILGQSCSAKLLGIMTRNLSDAPASAWAIVAYKDKNTTLSARMVFLMI